MKDIKGYKYTLDEHLRRLTEKDERYRNLYSSWTLTKESFSKALETVSINYPHYSLHAGSHSETIINNIEMLIGEERIEKLSPTDTWLILNAAYLHDIGMILPEDKIKQVLKSENFMEYKERLRKSYKGENKEAIDYLDDISNKSKSDSEIWPIEVRKYITRLISDYFRGGHARRSREYIDDLDSLGIDLKYNNLMQDRLISRLGDISFLHTADFDMLMKLPYRENGYASDYAHPRFVAKMIRLGDLLDTDNNRFNDMFDRVIKSPYSSNVHRAKHKGVKHILITPEEIDVYINVASDESYRAARIWKDYLEEAIKNITLNWTDIIPQDLTWYAPKLNKVKICINGKEDVDGLTNLKFNISQEKAFQVIEGYDIYKDKYVFLREVIQNAEDASKIQLWKDLKSSTYDGFLDQELIDNIRNEEKVNEITPFDIPIEIYNNYKVNLDIDFKEELGNKKCVVTIGDRGTGISKARLKEMCNVGKSYESLELKRMVKGMPTWLKPTGAFGIGLQSVFLVTDRFEILTKSESSETLKIEFETAKAQGYISAKESEEKISRGTEIKIVIEDENINSQLNKSTEDYFFENTYEGEDIITRRIFDSVTKDISNQIFPVIIKTKDVYIGSIKCLKESFDIIGGKKEVKAMEWEKHGNYYYRHHEGIYYYWNTDDGIYIRWDIKNLPSGLHKMKELYLGKTMFKGVFFSIDKKYNLLGSRLYIDIYGLDTKEYLSLSRDSLSKVNKEDFYQVINRNLKTLIEKIYQDFIYKNDTYINKYSLVLLKNTYGERLEIEDLRKIFKEENRNDMLNIIRRDKGRPGGEMYIKDILLNKRIFFLSDSGVYTNLNEKRLNRNLIRGQDIDNYRLYKENFIIVDTNIGVLLSEENIIEIKGFGEENNRLYLYSVALDKHDKEYIIVSDTVKKGMLKDIYFINRGNIAPIETYKELIVKNDSKIGRESVWGRHIIFPFRFRYDYQVFRYGGYANNIVENYKTKDDFINKTKELDSYNKIIDYVVENSMLAKGNREKIKNGYDRLLNDIYDASV